MFTIFHLLAFTGFIAGCVFGARVGAALAGVTGGVIGAIIGAYAGLLTGRLPGFVAVRLFLRSIRRRSAEDLREQLDREYFVSHLIIAESASRGEPVESFRDVVQRQLTSPSADVRRFGRANANLWFPELTSGNSAPK